MDGVDTIRRVLEACVTEADCVGVFAMMTLKYKSRRTHCAANESQCQQRMLEALCALLLPVPCDGLCALPLP